MLTKDQIETAVAHLKTFRGWTDQEAREKLGEFLAIKAAVDFASEQVTIDEVRARMQREGLMNPYRQFGGYY